MLINFLVLTESNLDSLEYNDPFVTTFEECDSNFFAFFSTKNLLGNLKKQASNDFSYISMDGTFKLNNLSYPTIVIGTVDKEKMFHLGNHHKIIF